MRVYSALEAKKSGALFYSLPEEVTPEMIDPLIRDVVFKINESGWVWTAESCQGHPDAAYMFAWGFNNRPMLRLVVPTKHYGEMLCLLADAMLNVKYPMNPDDPNSKIYEGNLGLEVFPLQKAGDYSQALVYVQAHNTFDRNIGLVALRGFAESVC